MTRRIPAQEVNRYAAQVRTCTNCGVTTFPQRMPVEIRPANSKRYSARGLCETCYHRQHRGGALALPTFERCAPCKRCGITRASFGWTETPLCRDCADTTSDLNETSVWQPPVEVPA